MQETKIMARNISVRISAVRNKVSRLPAMKILEGSKGAGPRLSTVSKACERIVIEHQYSLKCAYLSDVDKEDSQDVGPIVQDTDG